MNNPLISIVVPIYNTSKYLRACIDSIKNQTYENLEIILVDDGSTDGSEKICTEYKKQDERIQVIHQKNSGLSAARNAGLEKATGEYIAFIDSDDTIAKNFIKNLISAIVKSHADISVCGFYYVYKDYKVQELPKKTTITGIDATIKLLTKQLDTDVVAWNKLYKRSLFTEHKITYPVGKIHEDNLTTYKLYYHAKKVAYLSQTLYYYFQRPDSITHQNDILKSRHTKETAAKEACIYLKKDKNLRAAAEIALLLSKFSYLDATIKGELPEKFWTPTVNWLKKHRKTFLTNPYLSAKLRSYLTMIISKDGRTYRSFRRMTNKLK